VLGKPDRRMLAGVMQRHGLRPHELAVVGDRIYTDMAMARAAGAVGVLVLTGETTAEQAHEASPPPDLILNDVGELGTLLAKSARSTGIPARDANKNVCATTAAPGVKK
jgi:NagD protein